MQHPLLHHALTQVWCNPNQDRQYIFAPARLTPPERGVRIRYPILKSWVGLPTTAHAYHLFQIGYCPYEILTMLRATRGDTPWTSLTEWINHGTVYVECYSENGRMLPRSSVFYTLTEQDNLVLAVQELPGFTDAVRGPLYFRVYQNAYYASDRSSSITVPLYTESLICSHQGDMHAFQTQYDQWAARPGYTSAWINGYWVPSLSLLTMRNGDYVEFVYDASVYETAEFPLSGLPGFLSTLDRQRKYLIHYPKRSLNYIRYHDDIDMYIVDARSGHPVKGLYYHRNNPINVRMVSHQDYSVPVNSIQYYLHEFQTMNSLGGAQIESLSVRLHVRHSGYERALVYETNRLHELYRLDDAEIIHCMTGTETTVPYWHAAHLEQSGYTAIMQNLPKQITSDLVEAAYGYRAMAWLIGQTPQRIIAEGDHKTATLPRGLWYHSTIYEYNAEGHLLGWVYHNDGYLYTPSHPNTAFIEGLYGEGSYSPYTQYGMTDVTIPSNGHYRVYRGIRHHSGWGGPWVDITGSDEYTVTGTQLHWHGDAANQILCVRSDQSFVAYTVAWVPIDGCLRFTLSTQEDRGDGIKNHTLLVPYGNLDLFLNGRSLIEGLDYIVQFPEVVITNKAYLTPAPNTTEQRIDVRYRGFCRRDMSPEPPTEIGFVQHHALSMNRRYDVRDDRIIRIVVDGCVQFRDQVRFAEELTIRAPLAVDNGKPYVIEEIIVPMEPLTDDDTEALREKALVVDHAIGQYLTRLQPDAALGISAIPEQYAVVSPFLCKLLFQLWNQELPDIDLVPELTDAQVLALCRPYEDWLRFDPSQPEHRPDTRYVAVHPLNINATMSLNLYQYRFIHKVVRLYCPNIVDLAPFITLDPHRSLP